MSFFTVTPKAGKDFLFPKTCVEKRVTAARIRALLAVLALTGCSAAATPAPTAPFRSKPTEEQRAALMTDLAKVNPQLEGPRALVGASLTCRSILKGEPEEAQVMMTRDRFSQSTDQRITEPDAKRIIEIIKTNGFCVKA